MNIFGFRKSVTDRISTAEVIWLDHAQVAVILWSNIRVTVWGETRGIRISLEDVSRGCGVPRPGFMSDRVDDASFEEIGSWLANLMFAYDSLRKRFADWEANPYEGGIESHWRPDSRLTHAQRSPNGVDLAAIPIRAIVLFGSRCFASASHRLNPHEDVRNSVTQLSQYVDEFVRGCERSGSRVDELEELIDGLHPLALKHASDRQYIYLAQTLGELLLCCESHHSSSSARTLLEILELGAAMQVTCQDVGETTFNELRRLAVDDYLLFKSVGLGSFPELGPTLEWMESNGITPLDP